MTGATILIAAYFVEWTFRGYMDYQYLRTINLRFVVPWYDAIPQIGAVLLIAGWCSRRGPTLGKVREATRSNAPTQLECLGVCLLVVLLIALNRPRVSALVRATVGSLQASDRKIFKIEELRTMRANVLLLDRTKWQRRHLNRLDQCEEKARRMGWGRDAIRNAFGHRFIPGLGDHLPVGKYNEYDAAALTGPTRSRAYVRPAKRTEASGGILRRGTRAAASLALPEREMAAAGCGSWSIRLSGYVHREADLARSFRTVGLNPCHPRAWRDFRTGLSS